MKLVNQINSLFITACLSAGFVAHAGKIDDMAQLPVTGVHMVKSGDKMVLMSTNGRFIFDGVFDTWNDKTISNVSDVRDFAQRIDIIEFDERIGDLHYYSYGNGSKIVAVFIDPNCGYCSKLIDEMKPLKDEYTFKLMPVGILGKDSQLKINGLSCMHDDEALEIIMSHQYEDKHRVEEGCKKEEQTKTLITAKIFGITAVPYMISPNNIVRKGGFTKANELQQFLARK